MQQVPKAQVQLQLQVKCSSVFSSTTRVQVQVPSITSLKVGNSENDLQRSFNEFLLVLRCDCENICLRYAVSVTYYRLFMNNNYYALCCRKGHTYCDIFETIMVQQYSTLAQ